jgi:PAS domain S-box-containing protein
MSKAEQGTVLIVDHDPTSLDALSVHLSGAGFQVMVAQDGASALKRVQRSQPDIILLDVNLPDMAGLELHRRLEENEQTAGIPVIFVTDKEDEVTILKILDTTTVDYITKPFAPHEVIARVNRHLAFHNLQSQLKTQQVNQTLYKKQEEENRSLLLLLDTLDAECFIKGKDGIYQYINRAYEEQFGVKREDIIGKDDVYVFGAETAVLLQENDQRIMASKKPESVEESTYLHGTKYVVYLTSKTPILDETGNVSGICGVGIDITHRKKMERALRESEQRYRNLFEQSLVGHVHTGQDGNIKIINPAVLDILGYDHQKELVGQPAEILWYDPAERAKAVQTISELGYLPVQELTARSRDGEPVYVLATSTLERDDAGEVIGLTSTLTDLTAFKKIEQALQESEERYRDLYENAPNPYFSFGPDGVIRHCNRKAGELLGCNRKALVGKPVLDLYTNTPQGKERALQILKQFQTGVSVVDEELQMQRADGMPLWISLTVNAIVNAAGEVVESRSMVVDITERVQMKDALQTSQQLLQSALDALSVSIAVLDDTGMIVMVNASWRTFADENNLGWEDYGVGRNYLVAIESTLSTSTAGVQEAVQGIRELLSGQRDSFSLEYDCHSPREERWFVMRATCLRDSERGAVAISHENITERVWAEKQLAQAAATAERERLARDLHDSVSQSLFMAASITEVLPRVLEQDPDAAQRALTQLRWLSQGALAEMRTLLLELRPAMFEKQEIATLLRQLTDGVMAKTRIPVGTTVVGECNLPNDVRMTLYRIAQEALNNIIKHAQANEIFLNLRCEPDEVMLSIRDDGRGFDPNTAAFGGMGISIMGERAQAVGAEFDLESKPDQGTKITVTWSESNHTKEVASDEQLRPNPSHDR